MKRFVALLSACLLVSTLSGCFGSTDQYKTPSNLTGKESTQQTTPKTSSPPAQTQSAEETFRNSISSDTAKLTDLLTRQVTAAQNGEVSTANQIYNEATPIYNRIVNLSVPAGYEDIRKEYVTGALSIYNAINYLAGAATGKASGDQSLFDYYSNLANAEIEDATAAMNRAKELASAKLL